MGREEQRTNGDGRRRVYKRQALWRSLPLKTFLRRDQDSLFCKKVKVSLYTFDFCFVNCFNTSHLMLLIGSRLLKLLVTMKCISTRILFLFNFLLLQQRKSTSSKSKMSHKRDIAFSGAGFMGIYYVGVTKCIATFAPDLLQQRIGGTSAGGTVKQLFSL